MISFLQSFEESDETDHVISTSVSDRASLVDLFRGNDNFVKECLVLCLEKYIQTSSLTSAFSPRGFH